MAQQFPFQPMGKTVIANVGGGIISTVNITADSPCNQLRFYPQNNDVFVRVSTSAGNSIVSLPIQGTPAYGMPVEGGIISILTGWQSGPFTNLTVSMMTSANTAVTFVYITPGEGLQ